MAAHLQTAHPPRPCVPVDLEQRTARVLRAVVERPGEAAAVYAVRGESGQAVGAQLRLLREAGLAVRSPGVPAQWAPTSHGRSIYNELKLRDLRGHALQKLAHARAREEEAEALWLFADALTEPGQPQLCQAREDRRLTFSGLRVAFAEHVGTNVLVSVDDREQWPPGPGVTVVGELEDVEADFSPVHADLPDVSDLILTLCISESGFVRLSRRAFNRAWERGGGRSVPGDIIVEQGNHRVEIWFEP